MSDLSKVLGDLYGATDPDSPPVRREPSAEQRQVKEPDAVISGDGDLQSVLDEALATAPATWSPAAEEAEEWADTLTEDDDHLHSKGALRAWTRTDDDFLPQRGRKWNHRRKHH